MIHGDPIPDCPECGAHCQRYARYVDSEMLRSWVCPKCGWTSEECTTWKELIMLTDMLTKDKGDM